jgi:hypothetical protein
VEVLLKQVDGKLPNLALMKISAYHKQLGDEVYLNNGCADPDMLYVSCIYKRNGPQARGLATMFPNAEVVMGGSGISLSRRLPKAIEHRCPDYDLYGIDYSMGFTSRGCVRKCGFCVVPIKEQWDPYHADLDEFLRHDKLMLLDNNLTASPRFGDIVQDLIDRDIRVCFNQGLDLRLMDEEKAQLLAQVQAYDVKFKRPRLYFAWDSMDLEAEVVYGIETLQEAGVTGSTIMVYILMGYDTTLEEDEYRAVTLTDMGVEPFAMVYEKGNNTSDPMALRKLAKHINRKAIWRTLHPRKQEVLP